MAFVGLLKRPHGFRLHLAGEKPRVKSGSFGAGEWIEISELRVSFFFRLICFLNLEIFERAA